MASSLLGRCSRLEHIRLPPHIGSWLISLPLHRLVKPTTLSTRHWSLYATFHQRRHTTSEVVVAERKTNQLSWLAVVHMAAFILCNLRFCCWWQESNHLKASSASWLVRGPFRCTYTCMCAHTHTPHCKG